MWTPTAVYTGNFIHRLARLDRALIEARSRLDFDRLHAVTVARCRLVDADIQQLRGM